MEASLYHLSIIATQNLVNIVDIESGCGPWPLVGVDFSFSEAIKDMADTTGEGEKVVALQERETANNGSNVHRAADYESHQTNRLWL